MRTTRLVLCLAMASFTSGCRLQEVRSKAKLGPEFRHKGGSRTEDVRWTVQQGFEFKWDRGISTGVTYRRRDVDQGSGDHDDGVWFDFSFPIWKAPKKPDPLADRVRMLEKRLAELEREHAEKKEAENAGT